MNVSEHHSHLNGREYLKVLAPARRDDIVEMIGSVPLVLVGVAP